MTTPNQPAPDYGLQWADLSYEIGGGLYNYGQEMTQDIAKWLIYGPKATLENIWELMEHNLLKQDLEVLQIWEPFIPGKFIDPDFKDVPTAVNTILEFFAGLGKLLSVEEWTRWLEEVFGPFFTDTIKFIEDALAWLADVFEPFFDFVNTFIDDALAWLEEVFKPLEELVYIIEDLAEAAWDFTQDVVDALMQGFHGWFDKTGFKASDLQQMGVAIGAGLGELNHVAMRVLKLEGLVAKILENFSTYTQSLSLDPTKWNQWYTGSGGGTLGILNGYAQFIPQADTVNRVATAINKVASDSDAQTVQAVISKPFTDTAQSANLLIARADPTKVNGDQVFAKLTDSQVSIGFVKDGATTVLGTVNNQLRNGSTYTLETGVDGAANTFRVLENSREVLKVTDALNQSSVGEAFRSTGFGTVAPNSTARPGIVAAFGSFTR